MTSTEPRTGCGSDGPTGTRGAVDPVDDEPAGALEDASEVPAAVVGLGSLPSPVEHAVSAAIRLRDTTRGPTGRRTLLMPPRMPHDGPDRALPAMMRIMGDVNTEVGTDQGATVAGTDEEPGFDAELRERLASAVDVARAATEEFAITGVGEHLGTTVEAAYTTTHRFASELPGYRGWYWACVLALVPGGEVTVDEIALLPGDDALVAPEWVPWEKRIRPGDLGAGDLLPPAEDDERLVPGYVSSGDEALDEAAERSIHLSSPFPAVPDTDEKVDELYITRTWQFLPGDVLRTQ